MSRKKDNTARRRAAQNRTGAAPERPEAVRGNTLVERGPYASLMLPDAPEDLVGRISGRLAELAATVIGHTTNPGEAALAIYRAITREWRRERRLHDMRPPDEDVFVEGHSELARAVRRALDAIAGAEAGGAEAGSGRIIRVGITQDRPSLDLHEGDVVAIRWSGELKSGEIGAVRHKRYRDRVIVNRIYLDPGYVRIGEDTDDINPANEIEIIGPVIGVERKGEPATVRADDEEWPELIDG